VSAIQRFWDDQTGWISVEKRNGRWNADLVADRKIIEQFREEAGLADSGADPDDAFDRILSVAASHGFGLETGDNGDEHVWESLRKFMAGSFQ
jgi:hypothetical protein